MIVAQRMIAAAFVVLLFAQNAIQAESPEITLKIIPTVVKLSPNNPVEVLVVVSNHTAELIREIQLTPFRNADVKLVITPPQRNCLQHRGSLVWIANITKTKEDSAAGSIHFQLNYKWNSNAVPEAVLGVAVGTLEIQDCQPEAIEKIATVRIETTLDLIQEKRKGSVFLIVSNISGNPITIKRIRVDRPRFIRVKKQGIVKPQLDHILAPQESHTFPFIVTASNAVQPGKHLLLFEVYMEQVKYNHTWKGTLTAIHKFDVGVLGETEILTVIGVPSFLLLPGFLILVTFRILWTYVKPKTPILLEMKSAEFWTISIFVSLIAAIIYPIITKRNYLESYGLRDVMSIWFGSCGMGTASWIFYIGVGKIMEIMVRTLQANYIPSAEDTPDRVLRKLSCNNMGLKFKQVKITVKGEEKQFFDITPPKWKKWLQSDSWVAPEIVMYLNKNNKSEKIKTEFDEIRAKNDVEKMAELSKQAELKFSEGEGPIKVQRNNITPVEGGRNFIIKLKD